MKKKVYVNRKRPVGKFLAELNEVDIGTDIKNVTNKVTEGDIMKCTRGISWIV